MVKKRMLLVFNPKSGTQKFPDQLSKVIDKFTEKGFLVTTYPTQSPGELGKVIPYYADEYDYVVCSGGDGTIREAIDAMLPLKSRPVFGVIPSGTVNDFSNSLGIPKDIPLAADAFANGVSKPLDIGKFGDKHFSYVAAFGLLTDVSYATPQSKKNMLGSLAYFFEGVKRFGTVKSYHCVIKLDDEVIRGDFVLGLVANSHSVAGIKLPEEVSAQMDDGLFEVILLQMPESFKERQSVVASLFNQEINTDFLTIRKARKVTFASSKPVAWTLDGDFGGEYTEVAIENLHRSIKVMVPSNNSAIAG